MNISTFGSFTTARLGISASQYGLNVTGNNISNLNTYGYTRQRLDQISLRTGGVARYASQYSLTIGTGVLSTGISRIRDPYLDIRFRDSQANVGAMDAKLAALQELSQILDEVGKGDGDGIVDAALSELLTALQNLSSKAGQQDADTQVRNVADTLAQLLNKYSDMLNGVTESQERYLNQDVDRVNELLEGIAELNNAIMKSEMHGDAANELRDQRDLLVDELSQYMKIKVEYEKVSVGGGEYVDSMVIRLDGNDKSKLVDGKYFTELTVGNSTASYAITLADLRDAKGDVRLGTGGAIAQDGIYGSIQSIRNMLLCGGEYSTGTYGASQRGIPYYQGALDALANTLANAFNDANNGYLMDKDGNYLDSSGSPITYLDGGGNPVNLTKDTPMDPALEALLATNGQAMGGDLFSTKDGSTTITAGNIRISEEWFRGDVRIVGSYIKGVSSDDPDSMANENILKMISLMTADFEYKNAQTQTYYKGNFQNMLGHISSTLANDVKTTTTLLQTYAIANNDIFSSRESVMGADLNEEMTNMMQYQQSYAAACRLLTTFDEALDKLINGTGIVGR